MTRQTPPVAHRQNVVGVQKFKNDISLTDEQIATIAILGGRRRADGRRRLARPYPWPAGERNGKPLLNSREPDLVIKSDPYTMPAHHQDVWWRPTSNIPITEPRWVRAVEVRPGTAAGRKITHHAVAYLVQDDPSSLAPNSGDSDFGARAFFMEWAIGKGYDLYRPDSGKLILPGSQISWDVHIHAVGEEIRDNVELGIWLYPKGQEPAHRSYLTRRSKLLRSFQTSGERAHVRVEISIIAPQYDEASLTIGTVPDAAGDARYLQPHMAMRGKAMTVEAILPDGTTQLISHVGNFNFN